MAGELHGLRVIDFGQWIAGKWCFGWPSGYPWSGTYACRDGAGPWPTGSASPVDITMAR